MTRRARWVAGLVLGLLLAPSGVPSAQAQTSASPPATSTTSPTSAGGSSGSGAAGSLPEREVRSYNPKPLDVVREPQKLAGLQRRTIRLSTTGIDLMRGSSILRSIPFDATSEVTFRGVVQAVGDGPWVRDRGDGEVVLRSAFAQGAGTAVRFGGDGITTIRLLSRPNVFIGGVGATATFQGVQVTSWKGSSQQVDRDYHGDRPFILYENRSTLDIVGSEISDLGSDRSMAYGLSWRLGSTGSVTDSEIHGNFFGIYTYEARDLTFTGNRIHDNIYYGIDPHDYTDGLRIEHNEVYRNGDHGIVFSVGVVNGVIADNDVHDNDANGIVMDRESDGNLIEGNRSEGNGGDGIVVLGSSKVVVRDNLVRGNRVGIRLNHDGAGNLVQGNRIVGNREGVEVYQGAMDTLLTQNQIVDSTEAGIVFEEVGSVSRDDRISGSPVGIEVEGPATILGTTVEEAERAVYVTSRGIVEIDHADLGASDAAVDLDPGAIVRIRRSRLEAPMPFSGSEPRLAVEVQVVRSLGTLPWFAIAGLLFVVAALALQLFHRARNARVAERRWEVPAGVRNAR